MTAALDAARERFVDQLVADGSLRAPHWEAAFRGVPRHSFLRRFFRLTPDGERWSAVDEADDDWGRLIYSDAVLSTQLDDDGDRWSEARASPIHGTPTSSATQPSLMATMLEALDPAPGHRVLEAGTGTGYNAALLAHQAGPHRVTTIEVDAAVSATAARALTASGGPEVLCVVGDGAAGCVGSAPFDRIAATYSVPVVPAAWIEQLTDGGTMVVPLGRPSQVGLVARLVGDGGSAAHGHLLPVSAHFMPTRVHSDGEAHHMVRAVGTQPATHIASSELPVPMGDGVEGWTALAGLLLPDVHRLDLTRPDGDVQWLVAPDGSWAYHQSTDGRVEQGGPRLLWSAVERIHQRWRDIGAPPRELLGMSVHRSGSVQVWVDHGTGRVPVD